MIESSNDFKLYVPIKAYKERNRYSNTYFMLNAKFVKFHTLLNRLQKSDLQGFGETFGYLGILSLCIANKTSTLTL